MRYIVIIISLMVLSGCAGFGQVEGTSGYSPEQWKQMHGIRLLEGAGGMDYDSLGEIKGLSCQGSMFGGSVTKENAMRQLRIKAYKLNANAILNSVCIHSTKTDWENNCYQSWVCTGEAVYVR